MSWSTSLACPEFRCGHPGLADQFPAWHYRAGNGSRLEPGGLSVPGDGRGSGRPDPR